MSFNFSYRRVGKLHFVKVGRFCFMFCIAKQYRSLTPSLADG